MKNTVRKSFKPKRKKQRQQQILSVKNPNSQTIFAIILAALNGDNNSHNSHLIMHCLNLIHRSILRTLSPPILSLLPILLTSSCGGIARKTAVIVGAASLESMEINEMIALEDEIMKALLYLLTTSTERVLMHACNAILDLSTTSLGRLRLLHFSAIEKVSVSFSQASQSLPAVLGLSKGKSNDSRLRIVFKEDNATIVLLNAAVILINSCTIRQLQDMPKRLCQCLVIHLKRLWEGVHQLMLCGNFLKSCQKGDYYVSNIEANSLAESIFRFCINDRQRGGFSDVDKISRSILQADMDLEQFISNYWEKSPLFIRGSSNASIKQDNISSTLANFLNLKEEVSLLLPSLLKRLTSCPPTSSDELDIIHLLEEVRNHIGCPLIYQQDIRVVKARRSEAEVHYFPVQSGSCSSQDFLFLHINEILKCQDAYDDGYTIALRGMGFRFESIATVADGFASLFGQPSAGVNMYLTPSNSQGLACHSDDHCVFVYQLAGEKEWKIYPQSNPRLPHLYESTDNWTGSRAEEQPNDQSQQFLLKEGDVLYIPRGFPHEARAVIDGDVSGGFSLHLTLAIEVEPPFEWEGFTHIALDCWFKKQKGPRHRSSTSLCGDKHAVSVLLFHVSIKEMGNLHPDFRKACLVGSVSLSSASEGWMYVNQRKIFNSLITRINAESNFLDAVSLVQKAALNHEDIFHRERWLRHLNEEGENIDSDMTDISSADAENLLCFCNRHKDLVEAAFLQVKSTFCNEILFEDVEPSYKKLLERYKVVRNHYTDGMLSLHLARNQHETKL